MSDQCFFPPFFFPGLQQRPATIQSTQLTINLPSIIRCFMVSVLIAHILFGSTIFQNYARYVTRQKRADAKKAVWSLLSRYGESGTDFQVLHFKLLYTVRSKELFSFSSQLFEECRFRMQIEIWYSCCDFLYN